MNTNKVGRNFLITLIVLLPLVVANEITNKTFRRLFDNYVMDNKNHYLRCQDLPKYTTVEDVVLKHKDKVEEIITKVGERYRQEDVVSIWSDGCVTDGADYNVRFCFSNPECMDQGKTDILITYPSHSDRVLIEHIIGSDTFYGVPYRLKNI